MMFLQFFEVAQGGFGAQSGNIVNPQRLWDADTMVILRDLFFGIFGCHLSKCKVIFCQVEVSPEG